MCVCVWGVSMWALEVGEVAATNREDKWMTLTFLCSQRAGQQPCFHSLTPPSDSPLHFVWHFWFTPFFSLSLSLFLKFDWHKNVALLKVAAEEQWEIVLLHTHQKACRQTLIHMTRHGCATPTDYASLTTSC